jgi:hypothetical protein
MLEAIFLTRALMSIEMINTLAAVGTFVVIAATAIAALIQLRHLRAGNQLQAMLDINDRWNGPELQRVIRYVRYELPDKVKDPGYARSLEEHMRDTERHPEMQLADWWEQIGTMVKHGLIMEDPFLDLGGASVVGHWNLLTTTIAIVRVNRSPAVFENFEYLAAIGMRWLEQHPDGNYPKGLGRLPLPPPPKSGAK